VGLNCREIRKVDANVKPCFLSAHAQSCPSIEYLAGSFSARIVVCPPVFVSLTSY
jgi:hypothetical protein